MDMFFEKMANQSRSMKRIGNAIITFAIVEAINNFLLDWPWLSMLTIGLLIVSVFFLMREVMERKGDKRIG